MLIACAAALALVSVPTAASATAKEPGKEALEALLESLDLEYRVADRQNVNETPLHDILQDLSKRYGITCVINVKSFDAGMFISDKKPDSTTINLRGIKNREFLNVILGSMNATYLVHRDHIEIVSVEHAAKETKSKIRIVAGEERQAYLCAPLVSTVVKEKPLNEAVSKLADTFGLNVIVSPQAGDARTAFVSARLMNVPADKALELLALQADLRVVKKGNAFVITSREHAEGLFNEKQDRERQKIELEKLREAPVAPQPKM
jgi:type II secretory pathway component GspD/PulD (secretin)